MSDLIKREDVNNATERICSLCEEYKKYNGVMCGACHLDDFIRIIDDIPSAEPERKTGKWIEREVFESKGQVEELQSAKCSVCGKYNTTPYLYYFDNFPYCPSCGADMRGEE